MGICKDIDEYEPNLKYVCMYGLLPPQFCAFVAFPVSCRHNIGCTLSL
jgi:hypothetical protein